ncbi:MAG: YciI family protein [Candidatus Kariarchaeaceae archaeon]|jgi:uncharacterized protein YciI
MPEYYAIIKPYRDDFMTREVPEESEIMRLHFQYLKTLMDKGKLIMAGPTLVPTDPFGVYILETETESEARALMDNDPAVLAGIQQIQDFRPIRVSLLKYRDT